MADFNPLLAAEGVLGKISYPTALLPKHNGVRGCVQGGALLARSKKPIPNIHSRTLFGHHEAEDLEGELVVGAFDDESVFSVSTSGVGAVHGTPDVHWYLFDIYHPTLSFQERHALLYERHAHLPPKASQASSVVPLHVIHSDDELVALSDKYLSQGFEGVVLKSLTAKYKTGRSTALEQVFMRYCPWLRGEALILSIEEGKVNTNVSKKNELGYLKKSTHKANMVGSGRAGSVNVRDLLTGIEFSMAVPTDALQQYMWGHRDEFLLKVVKYKYKPAVKVGGRPRFPQWEGLRHPVDM